MTENETKADLIKKALTIVDELADVFDEQAEFDVGETEEILELAERAQKLKKHRLWKLK